MKNNIKIRVATKDDYNAINALYYESYSNDARALPGTYKKMPDTIIKRSEFIDILDDNSWDIFVAENNNDIVGFICVAIEAEKGGKFTKGYKRVSIEELYCNAEHQKQEIYDQLIHTAENWAKKKHVNELTSMVYNYNKDFYKQFEKNNYKPFSTRMNKTM